MVVPRVYLREWQGHQYWVLCATGEPNAVLFAPTLRLALLLTPAAEACLAQKKVPPAIEARLKGGADRGAIVPCDPAPTSFHLGLGLTHDCTLRCLYCHASADASPPAHRRVVEHAISHAFEEAGRLPDRTLAVSFAVGGEPTYPWGLFKWAVQSLREGERTHLGGVTKVFVSMTTNGYYGEAKRTFISAAFDHLTLSFDGLPFIQDLHRPTKRGGGSYAVVTESIRHFLTKKAVRVGLRATVSNRSVDHLSAIVQHCADNFGSGYTLSFEPMLELGRAAISNGALQPPEPEKFFSAFIKARRVGQQNGIRIITSGPSVDRLVRRYCGAMAIPSFAVCLNGTVTACHRDSAGADYGYGHIQTDTLERVIDLEGLNRNAARSQMPPSCAECFIKWNCAGDCPDLRHHGWNRCNFNKALAYHDIIGQLYNTKGG